jgi:hypothetical protein
MSCPKPITYGYSGQVWGSFINVRFLSKAAVRKDRLLTLLKGRFWSKNTLAGLFGVSSAGYSN